MSVFGKKLVSPFFAFESKGLNISSKKLKAENRHLKEACKSQRGRTQYACLLSIHATEYHVCLFAHGTVTQAPSCEALKSLAIC